MRPTAVPTLAALALFAAPLRGSALRSAALPVLAALTLLAAPLPHLAAADNTIHEDEKLNYHIETPPEWITRPTEALQKFGAAVLAERIVEAEKGWGGRVLHCVTDQPPAKDFPADYERTLMDWQLLWSRLEELDPTNQSQATEQARESYEKDMTPLLAKMVKDLTTLAESKPEILKPMMARFGGEDPKKWPPYEIESSLFVNGLKEGKPLVPAIRIKVKSVVETGPDGKVLNIKHPANDFAGNPAACEAHMTLFLVRRKLHRLITWIWPKVPDRQHLGDDNDTIEMLLKVVKSEAAEAKGGAGSKGGPDPVGPPIDPKVLGDSLEESFVPPNLVHLILLYKPKRFKTLDLDPAKDKEVAFKYQAQDRSGAQVNFDCLVYRRDQSTSPQEVAPYMAGQWYNFLLSNPKGDLFTAPFPVVKPKTPFLSLPDLSNAKKKAAPRPPPGEKKKPDIQDLENAGIATQEKGIDIGSEGVNSAWRACMIGKTEKDGEVTFLYYGFTTVKRTYFIRVFCYKDGFNAFKEPLAEILSSFQLFDEKDGPPRRREKPTKAKPDKGDKPDGKPEDKPAGDAGEKPSEDPPAKPPPDKSEGKSHTPHTPHTPDTSDKPGKK